MPTSSEEVLASDNVGYAMLMIDKLKLLIPQAQISSLEMATAMETDTSGTSIAGHFQFEGKSWPIFCLSNDLDLLTPTPLSRKVCILLQTDSDYFGILCEQALLLKQNIIQLQALPESIMTTNTPIIALAIYNDEIINISSAENLAKLLPLHDIHATASTELAL